MRVVHGRIFAAMNPAALEWWQWLLMGCGSSFATWIAYNIGPALNKNNRDAEPGCLSIIISSILGIYAALCFLLGVIRFVKWAWS